MRSRQNKFLRVAVAFWLTAVAAFAADFSRDIAPILMSECLACHSADKAKGGYRVHNYAAVLEPGKSRQSAVVPGKPEESELFRRLVSHDADERMPQDDDPLTSVQIELFRTWIAGGASLDRGETNAPLASIVPRANHPAPPEFYKRPLPILALAFTPDGQQLAVSGHHEIIFWNFEGKLQQRITNAPQRIHSISFHPTTNLLAIAGGKPGRSGEVTIYQDGAFLTNLAQHSDEFLSVAFSPNGDLLAAAGSDNSIRVLNTRDWQPVTTIQQHADWVTSIAFNTAGDKLVSSSRDRTARIYDLSTGELETTYPNHSSAVFSAVFAEKDLIASGGRDKTIHLWDIKEGKKRNEIGGAEADVIDLLATEKFLFAASANHLRQYKISDRKLVRTFSEHTSPIFALCYDMKTDRLAAGAFDGTVKIWDTKDGSLVASFIAAPLSK